MTKSILKLIFSSVQKIKKSSKPGIFVNYLTIEKMNHNNKKIKSIFATLFLLVLIAVSFSCEQYKYTPPAVDPNTTWHLQADIQPIFTANCISCHGGSLSPDLRAGKSYQALKGGGYVNLPAENSLLYKQMNSASHLPRSTETDRLKVLYWITQGAQNN